MATSCFLIVSLQGVQHYVIHADGDLARALQKLLLEGQGLVALVGESLAVLFITTSSWYWGGLKT